MNDRAADYDSDTLIVWNLIEDDEVQPGTSLGAQNFAADTLGTSRGVRVGDSETLPTPNVFKDSPLRTGVGYAVIVRRSDMQVIASENEFGIDALFAALDDARAGPRPGFSGELDFSRCAGGPFQAFELCGGDDECVGDARCAADVAGDDVCTPNCTSEDIACPGGATCVLGSSRGQCELAPVGEGAPAGGVCQRDNDCAEGLCLPVSALARTICRVSCDSASDCSNGYSCDDGVCLLEDLPEPEVEPEGCSQSTSTSAGLFAFALLVVSLRKRR